MISVSDVTMRYGAKLLFEEVSTQFIAGRRYGLDRSEWRRQIHLHEDPVG